MVLFRQELFGELTALPWNQLGGLRGGEGKE